MLGIIVREVAFYLNTFSSIAIIIIFAVGAIVATIRVRRDKVNGDVKHLGELFYLTSIYFTLNYIGTYFIHSNITCLGVNINGWIRLFEMIIKFSMGTLILIHISKTSLLFTYFKRYIKRVLHGREQPETEAETTGVGQRGDPSRRVYPSGGSKDHPSSRR